MYRIIIALAAILIVLIGYYFFYQDRTTYSDKQIEELVEIHPLSFETWKEFTSPLKKFTVMVPILPQHVSENFRDKKTNEIRTYEVYVSELPNGTIFMISVITYPNQLNESNKRPLLIDAMNDILGKNGNTENINVNFVEFKNEESIEFDMENDQVNLRAKTFMLGNTLYMLSRIAPPGNDNIIEFDFFVNSFDEPKE